MEKTTMTDRKCENYLDHVREYPCIACIGLGRINRNVFAHHEDLSFKYSFYKRATDFTAVPLCLNHHNERHKLGREKFWSKYLGNEVAVYPFVFLMLSEYFKELKDFMEEKISIYTDKYLEQFDSITYDIKKGFDEILDRVELLCKNGSESVEVVKHDEP